MYLRSILYKNELQTSKLYAIRSRLYCSLFAAKTELRHCVRYWLLLSMWYSYAAAVVSYCYRGLIIHCASVSPNRGCGGWWSERFMMLMFWTCGPNDREMCCFCFSRRKLRRWPWRRSSTVCWRTRSMTRFHSCLLEFCCDVLQSYSIEILLS